ncbi:hypothetical protein AC578_10844 [Pseudocercospora eumusae]|uniref:Uncharacterized protein n=1 Tax=Pseudocercospora eumusae TaxID=321146 RepID=A0A139H8V4_9PEZI|nr:hypothetical protein AC578_10844 [Pseudocercospora eumusae]
MHLSGSEPGSPAPPAPVDSAVVSHDTPLDPTASDRHSTATDEHTNLPTQAPQSHTTSPTGERIYHSRGEYLEAQTQNPVISDDDDPYGQTYSNLPTSSDDLPPWSAFESERKLYDFETHRRCMNAMSESAYDADSEEDDNSDSPLSYEDLFRAVEAQIQRLEDALRLVRLYIDAAFPFASEDDDDDDVETVFEEEDFRERLQNYQPFHNRSSYSDVSAASEMLSMTSDSGIVTTADEDSSSMAGEESCPLGHVEIVEESDI